MDWPNLVSSFFMCNFATANYNRVNRDDNNKNTPHGLLLADGSGV